MSALQRRWAIAPTRRLSNADDSEPTDWGRYLFQAGLNTEREIYEDEIYMLRGIV